MPAINPLPTPPSRNDPANFSGRADAFLAALPAYTSEANALLDDVHTSRDTVQRLRNEVIAAGLGSAAANAATATTKAAEAASSASEAFGYLQAYRATSYGALAADPVVDPNGNPPTVGDEYFNTSMNLLKRFNGVTWQASDIAAANLAAPGGSALVGFQRAGSGAVARTAQSKMRDVVSVKDFGAVGDGVTDDTNAIKAAIAFVKQAYYDKGGARLVVPMPSKFYKISDTLDLTEVWNLTIEGDNPYMFQRQAVADVDTDYATFHWYGPANKAMLRGHYTFGLVLENLSFNGRGIAKIGVDIAPETSTASVTRFVEMRNVGVKRCDFGIRIGDLLAQTDNGPINCYNLWAENNTSAGILINSGNNFVELFNPVLFNNGYAPTTGNSFISDGNNVGAQLNHLAGFLTITGMTADHSGGAQEVVYSTIFQAGGSIKVNGAWDDSPTKPFYIGGATRPIYFNGVTHYDGGMTPLGTPDSIIYSGEQPLVLESCYLYGNVQINSGAQASVIDLGTRFAREGAGFTGDMVTTYGGLIRMARSGDNSLDLSVGGDIPTDVIRRPLTVWSDGSHTGLVRATRGVSSYKITESLIGGVLNILGNAYFDANTGQFKAIKSGSCWRVAHSQTNQTFETATATSAGQVITFAGGYGFDSSSGLPNGSPALFLGSRKVTYESAAPASGTWSAGSIVFHTSPAAGGFVGWVCTAGGTPGTWKTFGAISA